MELLYRYLHAVETLLPNKQPHDIVGELRENILSDVEAREAELGRSLDEAELSAVLKRYGPPRLLAARYGPQFYLIGPGMFPAYWQTLRVSLVMLAIVCVAVPALALVVKHGTLPSGMNPFGMFFRAVTILFTSMTLVFAGIDLAVKKSPHSERYCLNWDPRSLPPVPSDRESRSITRQVYRTFLRSAAFFCPKPQSKRRA